MGLRYLAGSSRPEGKIVTASRRTGLRFKEKTPLWFSGIVVLIAIDSAVHFGLLWTVPRWALAAPDVEHTYRLPFRDGSIYFAPPWLGVYLNERWLGIGLLVILIALLVLHRDKLERGV